MDATTQLDALVDAIISMCVQLGVPESERAALRARGGTQLLQLLRDFLGRSTDAEMARLRAENGRLSEQLSKRQHAETALLARLGEAEAKAQAQQGILDAAQLEQEALAGLHKRATSPQRGGGAGGLHRSSIVPRHALLAASGGGAGSELSAALGGPLSGAQRIELSELRKRVVELQRIEASHQKMEAQLKQAREQLASYRSNVHTKRDDELGQRTQRAETQLGTARAALAEAQHARSKAERAAATKEEALRALRKEHTALGARHRALQAALREREAERFTSSAALSAAAEGTAGYAAVLKEQARAKQRQVEALQQRVGSLMQAEKKAKQREGILLQERAQMEDQLAAAAKAARNAAAGSGGGVGGGSGGGAGGGVGMSGGGASAVEAEQHLVALRTRNAALQTELRDARNLAAAAEAQAEIAREEAEALANSRLDAPPLPPPAAAAADERAGFRVYIPTVQPTPQQLGGVGSSPQRSQQRPGTAQPTSARLLVPNSGPLPRPSSAGRLRPAGAASTGSLRAPSYA